jgi:iron(II)-dependent oxidoreductase
LIGNVWEWTADALTGEDGHGPSHLCLSIPMKTLRGGAFDTYFENHATCQFPSGDIPLARKHNVGFRCAIGLCDLADPMPYHELDRGEDKPVLAHEHEEAVAAV